jgi:hypothetical protein
MENTKLGKPGENLWKMDTSMQLTAVANAVSFILL